MSKISCSFKLYEALKKITKEYFKNIRKIFDKAFKNFKKLPNRHKISDNFRRFQEAPKTKDF